jgi:hypothetical protein
MTYPAARRESENRGRAVGLAADVGMLRRELRRDVKLLEPRHHLAREQPLLRWQRTAAK